MDSLRVPYKNLEQELRVNFEVIERWAETVRTPVNQGLLAYTSYNTATTYTTTSTTVADVDATNLTVTFTAPSSGAVFVRLSGFTGMADSDSVSAGMEWQLREGTDVKVQGYVAASEWTANEVLYRAHLEGVVTGLEPGTSYTYKWSWLVTDSSATGKIYVGSTSGPAVMEVWEAP